MIEDFGTKMPEKVKCAGCGKLVPKTSACKIAVHNADATINRYEYYCEKCHYNRYKKPFDDLFDGIVDLC